MKYERIFRILNLDIAMNTRLAFSQPCPVRTSSPSTPFKTSPNSERPQLRWLPVKASAGPPPKPRFYKNPSRAIEKGGGFYVPGLQGARLRFFVPVASTVFLALNHASAGAATPAMTRSEGLAILAAVLVLGTAILDTMKEGKPSSKDLKQTGKPITAPEDVSAGSVPSSRSNSLQWASAVVTDLMPGIEMAHFRNDELLFGTQNVVGSSPGIAVRRVAKEQRPLYVAKSSSLPEEVTVPFLGQGDWSILMVPTKAEDVVVFASREELSRDSRRWLEVLSERIAE